MFAWKLDEQNAYNEFSTQIHTHSQTLETYSGSLSLSFSTDTMRMKCFNRKHFSCFLYAWQTRSMATEWFEMNEASIWKHTREKTPRIFRWWIVYVSTYHLGNLTELTQKMDIYIEFIEMVYYIAWNLGQWLLIHHSLNKD